MTDKLRWGRAVHVHDYTVWLGNNTTAAAASP
jgi:hypothetical protein